MGKVSSKPGLPGNVESEPPPLMPSAEEKGPIDIVVQHGQTSFLIPPRASSRKSSQIDPLASSQSTDYFALPGHW